MTTAETLIYKGFAYQEKALEGITDAVKVKLHYDKWSEHCIITVIKPDYIRIEVPNKAEGLPVSHYNNFKINTGLWLMFSDYSTDIEQFFWCRWWVQALIKRLLCRLRCKGPYLVHTIKI